MMTVSVEEAQLRWDELLEHVATNHEQVLIMSETAEGVLVAAEDYDGSHEQDELGLFSEGTRRITRSLATDEDK